MNKDIRTAFDALKQNGFNTIYAEDTEVAGEAILKLIPKGATVGIGDSVSVRQLKILEVLQKQGRVLINPFSKEISLSANTGEISRNQFREITKLTLICEFFLTGTDAVTRDGKLVNTDGVGNRVVGMIFGPEKVIIVAGRNKIVQNSEEAFQRIRNFIAPRHAKSKDRKTPCANTDQCTDCDSEERICKISTIIEKRPSDTEVTVLIINKDLGLGWNKSWPKERINKIYSDYCKFTWLKRPAWLE